MTDRKTYREQRRWRFAYVDISNRPTINKSNPRKSSRRAGLAINQSKIRIVLKDEVSKLLGVYRISSINSSALVQLSSGCAFADLLESGYVCVLWAATVTGKFKPVTNMGGVVLYLRLYIIQVCEYLEIDICTIRGCFNMLIRIPNIFNKIKSNGLKFAFSISSAIFVLYFITHYFTL